MVGNGVGNNLEGMVSICNGVRKFLTHMQEDGRASIFKNDWLMSVVDLHTRLLYQGKLE